MLLVFLPLYFLVQFLGSNSRSATYDEPVHLAAGYVALHQSDYRFDPTHPPLARMWAALPLLALDQASGNEALTVEVPPASWIQDRAFRASSEFLSGFTDPLRAIALARFMMLFFGAVTGVVILFWAWELFGAWPAIGVLALFTTEPNLAAHASLITTDSPVTCLFFVTVYCFWRFLRQPGFYSVLGTATGFALACAAKFSGIVLLPVLLVIWLASGGWRRPGLQVSALCLVACLVLAWGVIWATYGLHFAPGPAGEQFAPETIAPLAAASPGLAAVVGWVERWHLLPSGYSQGLLLCQTTAQGMDSYLNGETRAGGWWYYFPLAFFFKTPVVVVLAGVVGLVGIFRKPPDPMLRWLVSAPIVVYFLVAMTSRINLGVRHVLPVFPFVLLAGAWTFRWLLAIPRRRGPALAAAAIALNLALTARAWPYHLSYFSLVAGGPTNGAQHLSDSNVDWGQGLVALRGWMSERDIPEINLAYFGSIDPALYDITGRFLPGSPEYLEIRGPALPGYVALSSTLQTGVGLLPLWKQFYSGFEQLEPVATIANSIRVYWVNHWPEPSLLQRPDPTDTELAGLLEMAHVMQLALGMPDSAILCYDYYLMFRPDEAQTRLALGRAQLFAGATHEAIAEFTRAVQDSDDPATTGANAAILLVESGQTDAGMQFAQAAVAADGGNAIAHNALGLNYAATQRLIVAESSFARAVELDASLQSARQNLSEARRLLGKEPSAIRGYSVSTPEP